ncbi:MAG TPA: hypothetical protein VHB73_05005 [Alphaproteobacteria bacterium]|nr:hypothetical protein [Alphaproteobacteria bacterium]
MDSVLLLRAVVALAFVIGLLLLFAAGLRKWGGKLGLAALTPQSTRKRLQLLEVMLLDSRHRLAVVRMENREHLILLGPGAPVVVESRDVKEAS